MNPLKHLVEHLQVKMTNRSVNKSKPSWKKSEADRITQFRPPKKLVAHNQMVVRADPIWPLTPPRVKQLPPVGIKGFTFIIITFFFMVPSSCYLLNILGTFFKNRLNIWRKICWPRQWCVNNRLGIVINRCVVCYLLNWFTMLWIDCGGELAFFGNDRPQSSKAAGHCCCIFSSGGGGKLPIGPFFMAVIVSLSHVANGRHGRQVSSGRRGLHSESSSVEHLQYSSSSSSTCSADEQKMR